MKIDPGFSELIPNAEIRDKMKLDIPKKYSSPDIQKQSRNPRNAPKSPCQIIEFPEMQPIPIAAAKDIAHKYGYDQVVIIARRVGENGGEHVTTYGKDKANCDVAARIGNFLKYNVMGWGK